MLLKKVRKFVQTYYLAALAGVFLLFLTLLSFLETFRRVEERNELLFSLRTENAIAVIQKRMQDYIQILRSAQGLYAVSDTVTRAEWAEFVQVLDLDKNYPGILGLGYSRLIPAEALAVFEEQVRKSGFSDFNVWPGHSRDKYTSITYLEPFSARNKRAFGYDMYTEPTRQKAMKRAWETGKASLSGTVKLVQETQVGVQNGFLLYMPLYREGADLSGVKDRRKALQGWVFGAFRVNDLMKGILKNRFQDLYISVYDGPLVEEEALLFTSDPAFPADAAVREDLFHISPLQIGGRTWQFYIAAKPAFGYEKDFPWFVLAVGTIISSLIFLILYYLISIRQSNYLRELISEHATAALIILDKKDYVTFANPAAEKLLGYTQEELRQETFHQLSHHHYPDGRPYPKTECPLIKALEETNSIYNLETVLFHKQGQQIAAIINAQPIYERGRVVSHLLEIRDIGPEKLAEKALLSKNKDLQTLNKIGKNLSAELELNKLLQVVTDSCTELTGAEFGAFFYNKEYQAEENLMLYTLSGASIEDFRDFPMPRATAVFAPTFHGESPIRSDDITLDERFGKNAPFYGMPAGHLPVKSYLAVPVLSRSGEVLGGLFFGHSQSGVFTENAEDIVKGVAAQAAIAIDNSRLFETLSHKNEELIKINNDLDNFVYTASHDLKAPVLNIEGLVYALTAALKREKPERMQEILDKIGLSIRKFKETIQALTEVAKTNKNLDEDVASFSVQELVEDVLFSIDEAIREANAQVVLELSCSDFRFAKANMRSILHNLLTNALKYRAPERKAHIVVRCQKTAEGILLQVKDNGLGIDPTYLSKIFTMFSRYHTHVEGTGIGLYLVKRIVENNRGTISIDSQVGQGTTFNIRLPELA